MRVQWIAVFFLGCLTSIGQEPASSKAPNSSAANISAFGTVNGHVYLADMKSPARSATVYIQPAKSLREYGPPDQGSHEDTGLSMSIETAFDGSFSFSHVPYGSYYVVALEPGYVSPYTRLSLARGESFPQDGEPLTPGQKNARELVFKSIPQVDVESTLPLSVDVVLERGGAISGTITYDDGTPAAGVHVSALIRNSQPGKEPWISLDMMSNMWNRMECDDRGNYRISGLPAGKYIVRASFSAMKQIRYISGHSSSGTSTNGSSSELTVYSGNTPRMKGASSFSIALGEERNGEDIQIPISKMHTVSGNFVSALDGHVVNGGGAELLNADDKSPVGQANSTVDDPGFTFYFVYEGDYILFSPMSADNDIVELPQPHSDMPSPPQYENHPRHFYGAVSMPLHVEGDMTHVTIAVPEPTAKEAQMFKAMQQQMEQNQNGAPK